VLLKALQLDQCVLLLKKKASETDNVASHRYYDVLSAKMVEVLEKVCSVFPHTVALGFRKTHFLDQFFYSQKLRRHGLFDVSSLNLFLPFQTQPRCPTPLHFQYHLFTTVMKSELQF